MSIRDRLIGAVLMLAVVVAFSLQTVRVRHREHKIDALAGTIAAHQEYEGFLKARIETDADELRAARAQLAKARHTIECLRTPHQATSMMVRYDGHRIVVIHPPHLTGCT